MIKSYLHILALLFVVAFAGSACKEQNTEAPFQVQIYPARPMSIEEGTTIECTFKTNPPQEVQTIEWRSAYEGVATFDGNKLTAHSAGETFIWVIVNGVESSKISVTVTQIPESNNLQLASTSSRLHNFGDTKTVEVTFVDEPTISTNKEWITAKWNADKTAVEITVDKNKKDESDGLGNGKERYGAVTLTVPKKADGTGGYSKAISVIQSLPKYEDYVGYFTAHARNSTSGEIESGEGKTFSEVIIVENGDNRNYTIYGWSSNPEKFDVALTADYQADGGLFRVYGTDFSDNDGNVYMFTGWFKTKDKDGADTELPVYTTGVPIYFGIMHPDGSIKLENVNVTTKAQIGDTFREEHVVTTDVGLYKADEEITKTGSTLEGVLFENPLLRPRIVEPEDIE